MAASLKGKTAKNAQRYLLLKADAGQIPLRHNCVSFVIATPPYLGAKRFRRGDYCTGDLELYRAQISRFLTEAVRIVEPYRHIVLISRRPPVRKSRGARTIIFHLLQKRIVRGCWTHKYIRSIEFQTHYMDVKAFPSWWALPIKLYRTLLDRYSQPGETVAHVFSGSGNSCIAALEMGRKPVLIDLHYHRRIRRRLNKRIQFQR